MNAIPWNCADFHQFSFGGGSAQVFHETTSPSWHPFLSQIWNGTCDQGQLTREGLEDAISHGKVSELLVNIDDIVNQNFARTSGRCMVVNWVF